MDPLPATAGNAGRPGCWATRVDPRSIQPTAQLAGSYLRDLLMQCGALAPASCALCGQRQQGPIKQITAAPCATRAHPSSSVTCLASRARHTHRRMPTSRPRQMEHRQIRERQDREIVPDLVHEKRRDALTRNPDPPSRVNEPGSDGPAQQDRGAAPHRH